MGGTLRRDVSWSVSEWLLLSCERTRGEEVSESGYEAERLAQALNQRLVGAVTVDVTQI